MGFARARIKFIYFADRIDSDALGIGFLFVISSCSLFQSSKIRFF